ncbi:MAG: metallophosphoesterase family protein [Rhizobiaceae bacterium]
MHKLGLFAMVMFSLAHLSDVHLGPLPQITWHQLLSKRITGYANWQLNRGHSHQADILSGLINHIQQKSPDHIALTGDIINLGLDDEIRNAAKWLQKTGAPEKISLVCGNHDAYVPGALEHAFDTWQEYLAGDDAGKVASSRDFPVLRRRGPVSLILCNSACVTPPFFATGCFDQRQMNGLTDILEQEGHSGRCRVVLIHHPPIEGLTRFQKRLVGGQYFREAVKSAGAELVLHGHTHFDEFSEIDGPDGVVPVLGVPSAGQAPGGKRPAARYNLLTISKASGRSQNGWKIVQEQYGFSEEFSGVRQIGSPRMISGG